MDAEDVSRLLEAIGQGDPRAADQLLPLVYDELRKLAAQKLACEAPGQTLQPTALVHEAYLRLVGNEPEKSEWDGRGHFFAACAEAMRRILVENARRKRSLKRGGGGGGGGARRRQPLDDDDIQKPAARREPDDDILAIDEALGKLAKQDPLKAELVKLRYFGGCTVAEAARLLGVSPATADRYWAYARAWLHQEISRQREGEGEEEKSCGR